ncbi:MAG: hypothetical protein JNL67_15605 [Planctomycetaceae bacterium]|nr:hypothetical protein [Planctomycetaceae bacterium]
MKLIGSLIGWCSSALTAICLATFLSQGVLLLVLWQRGYLTTEKVARLQAVISGVDYHQIRADLKQAAADSEANPKTLANNQILSKQADALRRKSSDVALIESRLRDTGRRFNVQEEAFSTKVNGLEAEVQRATRAQLVRAMKNMATDQVKDNMMQIVKDGGIEDALAVVRQMTNAEQTKVFSEFQSDEEKAALNEILKLMRTKP